MPSCNQESTNHTCANAKQRNVYLASDKEGFLLKTTILEHLKELGYQVVDVTPKPAADFVESTSAVCQKLLEDEQGRGIVFDRYGAGSYMVACKHKGLIACECSDERSAYMTREHNNARLVTMGQGICGDDLAKHIAEEFLRADYAAGRHQIRVDMLNKMC